MIIVIAEVQNRGTFYSYWFLHLLYIVNIWETQDFFWEQLISKHNLSTFVFDEGEGLLFVYRAWSSNRSVCHVISQFGRHLEPAWHILRQSQVFSFSHPGAGTYFVTLIHRWNVDNFLFPTGLFIDFLQFSMKFFLYRKISILR